MLRSVAWLTLIFALVVVARIYQQQSFDQGARNIAASSIQKAEIIEKTLQAVDDSQLEELRKLTQQKSKSPIGEK